MLICRLIPGLIAGLIVALGLLAPRPLQAETQPPGSLWDQLVSQYQLDAEFEHPQVQKWMQRHLREQRGNEIILRRSRPWLWHVQQALKRRNMPAELALIPAVESANDPLARSNYRALGLWQFRSATALRFGLRGDQWQEPRQDLLRATEAALDYLEYLHDRFDHWLLAVAAYNSGEGRISKALKKAGGDRSFWALKLPSETVAHVPRWLALAALIKQPPAGFSVPAIPDFPLVEVVQLPGQIALTVAAELSGASLQRIQQLNAALRMGATAPDGPHQLLLPSAAAAQLREALQSQNLTLVRYAPYTIANGDSLSVLAERSGTTVAALRKVNQLSSNKIRVGKTLLLPDGLKVAAAKPRPLPNGPAGHKRQQHTVSNGESLWTIARRYQTTVRKLAHWNAMSTRDTLRAGRTLVVWLPAEGSA